MSIFAGLLLCGLSAVMASGDNTTGYSFHFRVETRMTEQPKPVQHHEWRLWRTPGRIQVHNLHDKTVELWLRDQKGRFSHVEIFPAAKRRVFYSKSDLLILNKIPDWERLYSMIDPALLKQLKAVEKGTQLKHPAQHYQGELGGAKIDLWWLTELKIPALFSQKYPDHEVRVQLLSVKPYADAPPPAAWEKYPTLDFIELGDREADPFVRDFLHRRHPKAH